ncbi:MAG: hypothetical protein ACD_60C00024G0023 [uncultured bacterium]|nr:MAG: hypothetical protein ACD_60C00024G0023 [uncultured bacterium]
MKKTLQFRFRQHDYLFQFKVGFFVLCLFLFILCCLLGVWQLHRYTYKKSVLTSYQERLQGVPLPFARVANKKGLQFQSVEVKGEYLNSLTMFIQNSFYHDQLGFEVLTPLKMQNDKKLVLVDRGWVVKPDDASLPHIQNANGYQTIKGYIKLLNEYQFILGENILQPNASPLVMQKMDVDEISRITHQLFYPFILRLNAKEPHGFIRDWEITTILPERHRMYAIQWFAFALILLIAYSCFCCERKKDE